MPWRDVSVFLQNGLNKKTAYLYAISGLVDESLGNHEQRLSRGQDLESLFCPRAIATAAERHFCLAMPAVVALWAHDSRQLRTWRAKLFFFLFLQHAFLPNLRPNLIYIILYFTMSVKELIDSLHSPSKEDISLVSRAYTFAENRHKNHKRFSGEPYFVHLFATAKSLADSGMDAATVAAGLLHDCIEDVGVKREEIQSEFGEEVLFLIEGVTKLGHVKYRGRERHVESLRKFFVAMAQDLRVLIIKLMDRRHNMQTLEHVPETKRYRIALETLEIYAPLADRLGMGKLKGDLEDLAFPYVYPEEYRKVAKVAKERGAKAATQLEKVRRELLTKFAEEKISIVVMEYRVKHLYSLYKKLLRKNNDIEKVYDLLALRIVVKSVDDCYRVLGIIHSLWRPLPGRIKDYIAVSKPNGYQSLHTTIFTGNGSLAEIQIRTEDMHRAAEYGIASHLSYKEGGKKPAPNKNLLWIARVLPRLARPKAGEVVEKKVPGWVKDLATVHESFASEEFLKEIKQDFFTRRIFVFTPQGDVVDLPGGSTPIDFAYSIHSDIGNHTAGVKINGKLVSLDTELQNGDIVEVQTKKSSRPSKKWLDIAKTSLAKRHIRSVLNGEGNF